MIAIPSTRASVRRVEPRLRQVRRHAFASHHHLDIPQGLAHFLLPGVEARFQMLRTTDQQHLLAVAESLSRNGAGDDLVAAGLLHDIGKAAPGITIRLGDRVTKVLLDYLAPGAVARLARRQRAPRYGAALWVLVRHAQTGADLAGQAGYNQRVQWLIANHDGKDPIDDPELQHLIAADVASDLRSAR